jgi:inward rectifier potassium channel
MSNESKKINDPGLGTSYQKSVKRMMNEDGTYNIKRIGGLDGFRDIYKLLVEMPFWKFSLFFIVLYLLTNLAFATAYYLVGPEQLNGIENFQNPFIACFYFSTQTFTTVGFGAIAPLGNGASIIAAFEAFVGLIGFSVLTGLIYGRFSKPQAKIGFTHNIIHTNYEDGKALMFKIVNLRNNVLLNTKIEVICSQKIESSDHRSFSRDYNTLELEVDFVKFFPLTWTIVHPINEKSPFYGMTYEQMLLTEPEIIILIEAHDETFSKTVYQKHSYAMNQWMNNVKFTRSFHAEEDGTIHLNIHKLNEYEEIES